MTNIRAQIPRIPHTCFWEITNACNLRCIHCEASAGRKLKDELSTAEALDVTDQLKSAGTERLILTGGEPIVRKDWEQIAKHASSVGLNVTVITNGMLVDESMVQRLLDAGVNAVSVSIDGNKQVHDEIRVGPKNQKSSSYEKAIRAVDLLVASDLKTAVVTQIHKGNYHDLTRMHEQMIELGIDLWQVQVAMPLGRLLEIQENYLIDPEQMPELTELLSRLVKDTRLKIAVADNVGYYDCHEPVLRGSLGEYHSVFTGCAAGCQVVALCSNGDVKGCPSHPRSFAVGNLREQTFAEIWDNRSNFSYNTEWDEKLLEGHCAKCAFRRLCRAGCTSMAFAVTGTIYDNPFCASRHVSR